MGSRDHILDAVRQNQPEKKELPVISTEGVIAFGDQAAAFEEVLAKIGGRVVRLQSLEEALQLWKSETEGEFTINTINCTEQHRAELQQLKAHDLALLDKACMRGSIGVAENGAVWVDEQAMVNRLLPFICEQLVIVLSARELVNTMHHAYGQLDVSEPGFGVFIAGPSKTADIEQSLVIGAHGPRSLTIYLIQE